jgi:hypothetical protein
MLLLIGKRLDNYLNEVYLPVIMVEYILTGKLYVPRLTRPLDFAGSFLRKDNGCLEGKMEFDERSNDLRDTLYGCLTNEDVLCTPHDGKPAQDHLVLFHTVAQRHIDRAYWLSKLAGERGVFDGEYIGIKEECTTSHMVEDVRGAFGWNVRDILDQTQGTRVVVSITKK